jgi:hypothetical protein
MSHDGGSEATARYETLLGRAFVHQQTAASTGLFEALLFSFSDRLSLISISSEMFAFRSTTRDAPSVSILDRAWRWHVFRDGLS